MPFGEDRADLRAAIPGTVIANEIRAIAGGLAGKRLDAIQVQDLMIDTGKGRESKGKGNGKAKAKGAKSRSSKVTDIDRAKEYHSRWAESLQRRLDETTKRSADRPKRKR